MALGLLMLAGAGAGAGTAQAQTSTVEQIARAEVPVYDDNMDDARQRAVSQSRVNALRAQVETLIAPQWIVLYDQELRTRVFNRTSRFIASFRARRLETSVDRTRYLAVLAVQVNRDVLLEDLRELRLPLLSDPVQPLTLLRPQSDALLSDATLRTAVTGLFSEHLALLSFRIAAEAEISAADAEALTAPGVQAAQRARLLARFGNRDALLLTGEVLAADQGRPGVRLSAWLLQRRSGELLGDFERKAYGTRLQGPFKAEAARNAVLASVVKPLLNQIQPGALHANRVVSGEASHLQLRVHGYTSVEDQESFERAFFKRNTPFEQFSLYAFAARTVTYQGVYKGNRETLAEELAGSKIGEFTLRRASWYNNVLELEVQRETTPQALDMRLFPREVRPPEVNVLLDEYFGRYNQLEVEEPDFAEAENNGWLGKANPIPFGSTFFGNVDSRADSDVFVGEALSGGEQVELVWYRIGRTNLSPALRIYDADGVLVKRLHPRSWLRHVYQLPKDQHRFYVEVGDRFGYLSVDSGGYRSYSYLMKVRRLGQ